MHFQGGADRTAGLTDSGQRVCEVREGKQDESEVSNRKAWAAGGAGVEAGGEWGGVQIADISWTFRGAGR